MLGRRTGESTTHRSGVDDVGQDGRIPLDPLEHLTMLRVVASSQLKGQLVLFVGREPAEDVWLRPQDQPELLRLCK